MQGLSIIIDEQRRPFLISTAVHLLFFLIAALWQIGFDFQPAEFTEVRLISGTLGASPQSTVITERRSATAPVQAETIRSQNQTVVIRAVPQKTTIRPAQKISQPPTHPVTPPSRRMLEDEQPQLASRAEGKLMPDMNATEPSINRDETPVSAQSGITPSSSTGRDSAVNRQPGQGRGGNGVTSSSGDGSAGIDQPFTIEGDAAQRNILHQVIPEYPSGLQKEEVLKIRFIVLADGKIGMMIPMRKGDPTLEKITLDALKQWRFNALPASAEQKNVSGIITFRYELQ